MGVAIGNFESAHQRFPFGSASYNYSLHVSLLPYIDQGPLHEKITSSGLAGDDQRLSARSVTIPLFLCPTDPGSEMLSKDGRTLIASNYAGNSGTGAQKHGYNGLFRHKTDALTFEDGTVRVQDVKDGLSNTAAISEILVGDQSGDRLRTNWNTDKYLSDLDAFAVYCKNWTPQKLSNGNWNGDIVFRGRPWTYGEAGGTLYNHVLTSNQMSCYNKTAVQQGIFTAASLHSEGVNLLFADGRVEFISDNIDQGVWSDFGSRAEDPH
jgi:prepilin-type processing-associated H-X9-DG protein